MSIVSEHASEGLLDIRTPWHYTTACTYLATCRSAVKVLHQDCKRREKPSASSRQVMTGHVQECHLRECAAAATAEVTAGEQRDELCNNRHNTRRAEGAHYMCSSLAALMPDMLNSQLQLLYPCQHLKSLLHRSCLSQVEQRQALE